MNSSDLTGPQYVYDLVRLIVMRFSYDSRVVRYTLWTRRSHRLYPTV